MVIVINSGSVSGSSGDGVSYSNSNVSYNRTNTTRTGSRYGSRPDS